MNRSINLGEVVVATALLLMALHFGLTSFEYDMGSLRRPGPGAAPLAISLLLGSLAVALLRSELFSTRPEPLGDIRGILLSVAGIAAWAALARSAGLLPATVALVLLVSLAERPWRPVRALFTCAVLIAICDVLFIRILTVPVALIGAY